MIRSVHASILRLTGMLGLMGVICASIDAAPLMSGDRIGVGGDGLGPVSLGLSTYPLGFVQLPGPKKPGVFIVAGRFSHDPGLFLYEWRSADAGGVPVLGTRTLIRYPADPKQAPPPGVVFQTKDEKIYGFWIIDGGIVRTRFESARNEFVVLPLKPLNVRGLPGTATTSRTNPDGRAVERLGVIENPDGSLEILLSVPDPTAYITPEMKTRRDPAFDPFDGRGIWRGGLPYVFIFSGQLSDPESEAESLQELRQASATQREALFSHGSLTSVNLDSGHERDLITGSYLGNLYHYQNRATRSGVQLASSALVKDKAGRAIRNDYVWTSPLAVPDHEGRFSDLIVGGEGSLTYYRFSGLDGYGVPEYAAPRSVLGEKALIYTGSLPVLNSVDWDGDGATDIITGNSEGKILFFRNHGTTLAPDFRPGEPLTANGETIHVQQGYTALQGPDEARWGYLSPVVADWNGDGLPDILASDARAQHTVYLNHGTKNQPQLAAPQSLYCDGLEVHGSWRVRPGAARWGSRMAYVALDDDDQFHLYWRIDDFNLRDGGKLRLEDGTAISANFLPAGGTGRTKFTLADWDGDGVMDILAGTPRHGSVPNPTTGLPQSRGLPGAAVLWLRNTGTNEIPKFAFPRSLQFKGKPVYFGQHECSTALTDLGGPGGPHLLVGDEGGRVHYFQRQDISWTQ
jgi:FG-GAP-like repeat